MYIWQPLTAQLVDRDIVANPFACSFPLKLCTSDAFRFEYIFQLTVENHPEIPANEQCRICNKENLTLNGRNK